MSLAPALPSWARFATIRTAWVMDVDHVLDAGEN